MHARVDSAIHIPRRELTPKFIAELSDRLSFPNPVFVERVRRGFDPGDEPSRIYVVQELADEVCIPRGSARVLRDVATAHGTTVTFEDRRVVPELRLPEVPAVSLRDYQKAAVDRLVQSTQGVAIVPCGGGKSRMAVGAIAALRLPALVLVHTHDLAEQWRAQIQSLLDLDAVVYGAGQRSVGPITIGLVQTLCRLEPEDLSNVLGRFGMLITDECHHCPAQTFRAVVDKCPAKYRLGLTATPEREDGLGPMIPLFFGDPIARVGHKDLIDRGVLAEPEIRQVPTDFDYFYSWPGDYSPMISTLAGDVDRNELIVSTVAEQASQGHVCLVLSGRIDHCELLKTELCDRGIHAVVLTSQVPKHERTRILNDAREGRVSVIVATSLADEGLDLPRLSRVFLVYPTRAKGRTVQRLGRLMRPHPDKKDAVLFDFVDERVPVLRAQARQRRLAYSEALGLAPTPRSSGVPMQISP